MADELAHGPNPAVSAQAGVGIGGYSQHEYSPGADPYSTGEPAKAKAARTRAAKAAAPPADEPPDDGGDGDAAEVENKAGEPKADPAHQSAGGRAGHRA